MLSVAVKSDFVESVVKAAAAAVAAVDLFLKWLVIHTTRYSE